MLQKRWLCLVLVVLTVMCFGHVYFNDFIHLDDPPYVTKNTYVRDGLTWTDIEWAFARSYQRAGFWIPLTWLSFQADASLFGPEAAGGFHLTNLLWHTVNVVLFFLVLSRMTGAVERSFVAAALFAIHPLRVESVAWITERKDMLSTTFLLLTLLAYHRYVTAPSFWRFALVVLAYALGLMSKPTLVTLPFALLLLDYWPLGRLRLGRSNAPTETANASASVGRLLLEKAPLLVMAAGISWLTMYLAQDSGTLTPGIPWNVRLSAVVSGYLSYLEKSVWPTNLAVLYPYYTPSMVRVVSACAVLAVATFVLLRQARSHPALIVGWLWFLGMLVPNIGFVQAGPQAFADRFTYIPHLGLMILIVWAVADLDAWRRASPLIQNVIVALVLVILGTLTWIQVWYWKNSETLFVHSMRVVGNNFHLHYNLSYFWLERGNLELAEEHIAKAVDADETGVDGRLPYGSMLWRRGKYEGAVAQLDQFLETYPDQVDALFFKGRSLAGLGRLDEARQSLERAIAKWPVEPSLHLYLGDMTFRHAIAYQVLADIDLRQGRPLDALGHLEQAAKILPELADQQDFVTGVAMGRLNRWPDAERRFQAAAERAPNDSTSRGYLAHAFSRQAKKVSADRAYAALLSKYPDWLKDTNDAAEKLLTEHMWLDHRTALELAQQVCEATDHKDARSLNTLAAAHAAHGEYALARESAARALKLTTDASLLKLIQERMRLYERNQPLPVRKQS